MGASTEAHPTLTRAARAAGRIYNRVPKPNAPADIDAEKLVEGYRSGRHHERERAEQDAFKRPDFREVRRSRDTPVTFRVFRETLEDIQELARAEGTTMVQILERAITHYKAHLKGSK